MMISFRVDSRSVVPPYLQIVQQVRQALRMGVLDVGDQLPTVREVVSATAINPNTVLKAYRDLEREGLIEARAGHGTFVRRRPPGPPPGTHSRLGRSLARWVREARERRARRRIDGRAAARHAAGGGRGGDRMTPAAEPTSQRLTKRYGKVSRADATARSPSPRAGSPR